MKTYTISFDNNITRNNTRTPNRDTNYSAIIDNAILANLKKNTPYLFGDTPKKEKKSATIYDFIGKKTPKTTTFEFNLPGRKAFDIEITKDYSYDNLLNILSSISKNYSSMDTYDFIIDGTPIKIFSDEIQIGYDLIPLNKLTKSFYDSLKESTKKTIIDIYIEINKD